MTRAYTGPAGRYRDIRLQTAAPQAATAPPAAAAPQAASAAAAEPQGQPDAPSSSGCSSPDKRPRGTKAGRQRRQRAADLSALSMLQGRIVPSASAGTPMEVHTTLERELRAFHHYERVVERGGGGLGEARLGARRRAPMHT